MGCFSQNQTVVLFIMRQPFGLVFGATNAGMHKGSRDNPALHEKHRHSDFGLGLQHGRHCACR
jgi:hypothetical protein